MSADCVTWSHHPAASPPTYGSPWTSSAGCAPPAARAWTRASTFARYCAVVGDQGVAAAGPSSSFNAIQGVAHAVDACAWERSFAAAAPIEAGSAGVAGSPTSCGSRRTKYVVAAPLLRNSAETAVPLVVTVTPGRSRTARTSGFTELSP